MATVLTAIMDGSSASHQVDIGSGRTMVRKVLSFATAYGSLTSLSRECQVAMQLHGHSFLVRALGFDSVLGDYVIDHLGKVTVERESDSWYHVRWGRPSSG